MNPASRRRLDRELVARGLADSLEEARRVIEDRRVVVGGAPAYKASTLISSRDAVKISRVRKFVSRAGEKLDGALNDFDIDCRGLRCLDVGVGRGGFTDCLLSRGAAAVTCVDVGYGEIAWKLRGDPRVSLYERTNFRTADPEILGAPFDLVVADLSFISLRMVAGKLAEAVSLEGDLLLLVKPQFEAKRDEVGRGGIVEDRNVWKTTLLEVAGSLAGYGWGLAGIVPSSLRGAEGNQEFFLWSKKGSESEPERAAEAAVGAVV